MHFPIYEVKVSNYGFLFYKGWKLCAKGKLNNGKREGYWRFYTNPDKKQMADGYYSGGKKTGVWYGYIDGKVFARLNYDNGMLDGELILYNTANGTILRRSTYSKGMLNGYERIYDGFGNIEQEGCFKNGCEEGVWIIYNNKTKKIKSKKYYSNGTLVKEDMYENRTYNFTRQDNLRSDENEKLPRKKFEHVWDYWE